LAEGGGEVADEGMDESVGGAQMGGRLKEPSIEREWAGGVMLDDDDHERERRGGGEAVGVGLLSSSTSRDRRQFWA
jgi:hypothetical protein